MSDEELALELLKSWQKNGDASHGRDKYWDIYTYYLEQIKEYKSNTIKGKIEYVLKKFDEEAIYGVCFADYHELIKNVKKILQGEL